MPDIPAELVSMLVPAASAFIGGIIGVGISSWVSFRLSDKTQKTEYYKIVYPQIISTVTELITFTNNLVTDIMRYHIAILSKGELDTAIRDRVLANTIEYAIKISSVRWLIGEQATDALRNMDTSIICFFNTNITTQEELKIISGDVDKKYEAFVNTVKRLTHIDLITPYQNA